MKKIKLLVLANRGSGGVGYYRSTKPHRFLAEKYGDDFDVDIDYEIPNTRNFTEYYKKYDIVQFHNYIDEKCITINALKEMGIITVCDIDDYWMLGSHHPMGYKNSVLKTYEPVVQHMMLADYVTTTTELFAAKIRQYNKNVFVIPNAIDVNEEQFIPKEKHSSKVRIGVICGSTHKDDIDILSSIHNGLKPEVSKRVQFVLCGFDTAGSMSLIDRNTHEMKNIDVKPQNGVWYQYEKILSNNHTRVSDRYKKHLQTFVKGGYPFTTDDEGYVRKWTKPITEYATHYNDIDILLAPLVESDFNRYKSQLKAIEAGVFGKAIIAQDFGPYTIDLRSADTGGGVIDDTANSLLVQSRKNNKNWSKYINMLVENSELREKLANNLHNTIIQKYTLDIVNETRAEFYRNIIKGKNND